MAQMRQATEKIAFQGSPGAYSDLACRHAFPGLATVPCETFEEAFAAVRDGHTRYAILPVENSQAGRVADIHHLLPGSELFIVGEHFERVRHCLLGVPDAQLDCVEVAISHEQALAQCRDALRNLGLEPRPYGDTAAAAEEVARRGDPKRAAVASTLAAEIHGLDVLRYDLEDADHNTTRFLVMAAEPVDHPPDKRPLITTIVFRVRNIPAALYKAIGGFATNGVNMTKLESYMLEGSFYVTQFYVDLEGHPDERLMALALQEMGFFTDELRILGTYEPHPFRERP